MIKVSRAQSPWITAKFAEAADICAVVHLCMSAQDCNTYTNATHSLFRSLFFTPVAEGVDDVFEGSVESLCEVERIVKKPNIVRITSFAGVNRLTLVPIPCHEPGPRRC